MSTHRALGALAYMDSDPRPVSAVNLVPLWVGEFVDHDDWCYNAEYHLAHVAGDGGGTVEAICVDALGRRCSVDAHFRRALVEKTYPIRYFWEMVPADALAAYEARAGEAAHG